MFNPVMAEIEEAIRNSQPLMQGDEMKIDAVYTADRQAARLVSW